MGSTFLLHVSVVSCILFNYWRANLPQRAYLKGVELQRDENILGPHLSLLVGLPANSCCVTRFASFLFFKLIKLN